MRTLPALLLAAFVTLVIVASATLATQFGGADWPTPPTPDTATRLITPTEAAGRATDDVTSYERGRKSTGPIADRTTRRESRSRSERRGGRGTAARPRGNVRREGGSAPRQRTPREDNRSSSPEADEPTQTEESTETAPAPQAPAAPVDPIPPVAGVEPDGNDSQARPQDPPAVPSAPAPPAGDEDSGDDGEGDEPSRHRGPIRHLLDHLLPRR